MKSFLAIVRILGFCVFLIFPNHHNTLIYSNLVLWVFKNSEKILSSVDVDIINRTMLKPSCTFMLISLSLCF